MLFSVCIIRFLTVFYGFFNGFFMKFADLNLGPQWLGLLRLRTSSEVLKSFKVKVEGKTALDVGSSTGGFTQVLLHEGAEKIISVDVGLGLTREIISSNLGDLNDLEI